MKCTCNVRCEMHPARAYRYEIAKEKLRAVLVDFLVLSGDKLGPGDASWQDVAGTAIVNLRVLANQLESAREGRVIGGPVVFPSPGDLDLGE